MPFDRPLLELVNRQWTHPALDRWGALVNATELWALPFGALALWLLLRGGARGRTGLLLAVVALGLGDGVLVKALKAGTARVRPAHALEGVRMVDLPPSKPRWKAIDDPVRVRVSPTGRPAPSPRSFPSGHAWNCFALATLAVLAFPRAGWLALIPAAAVAYARVYVGIHWPTDVIASMVGAPLLTWLLVLAWERLLPRLPAAARARLAPLRPAREPAA